MVAWYREYNEIGAEKMRKYYITYDEIAVASAKAMGWPAGIRVLTCSDVTFSSTAGVLTLLALYIETFVFFSSLLHIYSACGRD